MSTKEISENLFLQTLKVAQEVKRTIEWYVDNGCSRQMVGDKELTNFEEQEGHKVIFEDNLKVLTKGKGNVISYNFV